MIRSFDGKTPRIADSAFVSEAAYVIGDVEIGENAGIWPGAVVRGDGVTIRIGRNTIIQDNCVIHCDEDMEIGDGVLIGHSVVVHATRVGSNTLIGNNATVLEFVEIGSSCIIAAGCLVSPATKIPDNSFVIGLPGRIKGQASPEQLQRVRQGVHHYGELLKRYKEQGL